MIDITNMIEPESNPAALESERAMNANLTAEVDRLQARVAELESDEQEMAGDNNV